MSCGNPHEIPCSEVAQVLYLFIDNELENLHELAHSDAYQSGTIEIEGVDAIEVGGIVIEGLSHIPSHAAIEIHFQECPPCHEVLDRESATLATMKSILSNSCNEQAPAELQAMIAAQTQALAAEMAASTTTVQYSRTEITTTIIDENGAQTTIEIQSSTEYRGEFPGF